jgi:hypothetical protein
MAPDVPQGYERAEPDVAPDVPAGYEFARPEVASQPAAIDSGWTDEPVAVGSDPFAITTAAGGEFLSPASNDELLEPPPLPGFAAPPEPVPDATITSQPAVASGGWTYPSQSGAPCPYEEESFFDRVCQPFEGPCCACEAHWVNWRHGSDYLEGCIPEGYSALHLLECNPTAAVYGTPLNPSGPVEPGGSYDAQSLPRNPALRTIAEISLDIRPPTGELPPNRAETQFAALTPRTHLPGTHRPWMGTAKYWEASLLAHQPVYFEDVNLERNGYSYGIAQPLVSAAKFYATLPALPYLMTAYPTHEAYYVLGESRPGSRAPYVHERPPLRLDAAAVEAGVVTGLFFVIP